jgi:hypothetical protein
VAQASLQGVGAIDVRFARPSFRASAIWAGIIDKTIPVVMCIRRICLNFRGGDDRPCLQVTEWGQSGPCRPTLMGLAVLHGWPQFHDRRCRAKLMPT